MTNRWFVARAGWSPGITHGRAGASGRLIFLRALLDRQMAQMAAARSPVSVAARSSRYTPSGLAVPRTWARYGADGARHAGPRRARPGKSNPRSQPRAPAPSEALRGRLRDHGTPADRPQSDQLHCPPRMIQHAGGQPPRACSPSSAIFDIVGTVASGWFTSPLRRAAAAQPILLRCAEALLMFCQSASAASAVHPPMLSSSSRLLWLTGSPPYCPPTMVYCVPETVPGDVVFGWV